MKKSTKSFLIINIKTDINNKNFEDILPEKISILITKDSKKMAGIELNIFDDELKKENEMTCNCIKKFLEEYYVSQNTILISDNTKITNRALKNLFLKHNMDFIEFENCIEIGELIENYLIFKIGDSEKDSSKYDNLLDEMGIDFEKYEEGSLNICDYSLNILNYILKNEYDYELFV
ncbi:hypothetical protein P5F43_14960 [Clostridium perfringens]|uniref:hypothetical protein n=1 Tax=Clostridium TaxID=1485 RepID=UPI00224826B3|nr:MULTISPECIES: hypothetical protein [Clostridium]EGT4141288.1 hypothetical protein [Clostridium perfringens]ELC8368304.1 hypothetical protein [Clostridium perfringens]MCX0403545.1 hypothetical protein [Clostridium perfringens]MDK0888280.1 hypothetical protein [Clostridium perfringens]WVM62262.1 hypothetical protein V1657_15855 [Clostridium perfringens]